MPSELKNEEKIEQPLAGNSENQTIMHPRFLGNDERESFTDSANARQNIVRVVEGDDIQKALDNLEAIGGGILQFKTGIYRLQKGFTIPAFVTIQGEGKDNTRLDFEDRALQIKVEGTASSRVKNVRMKDLTIERSGHATAAVQFSFAQHFIIDNVRFSDNAANGLRIVACQQYTVFNCLSDNNGDDGFDLDGSGTTFAHARFNYFGCIATNNTGNGFAVSGDASNIVKDGAFVACEGSSNTTDGFEINTGLEIALPMLGCNASNNGGIGFDINSLAVKMLGCIAEDNTGDGFEVTQNDCAVIGCESEGNGTDFDFTVSVDTGGFTPTFMYIDPHMSPTAQTNWTTLQINTGATYNCAKESSGAQNDEISWTMEMPSGTYTFELMHIKASNRGIYSVQLDAVEQGTIDGYDAAGAVDTISTVTSIAVSGGSHTWKLKMATKNASASNYYGSVQMIKLLKTA